MDIGVLLEIHDTPSQSASSRSRNAPNVASSSLQTSDHTALAGWGRDEVQLPEPEPWTEGSVSRYSLPFSRIPVDDPYMVPNPDSQAFLEATATSTSFPSYSDSNGSNNPGIDEFPRQPHSPIVAREDQWQMYLSASLSNSMHSFDFSKSGDPISLSYPSEEPSNIALPQPSHANTESFPTSLSSHIGGTSDNFVDPFAYPNPVPTLSTSFPSSQSIPISRSGNSMIDEFLRSDLEGTPRRETSLVIPNDRNGTYSSLMELTPPAFDFGSARFSSLEAPTLPLTSIVPASPTPSPLRNRSQLLGWKGQNRLQVPLTVHGKRDRLLSTSPIQPHAPSSIYSSAESDVASSGTRVSKSPSSNIAGLAEANGGIEVSSVDEDDGDDGDSDDYSPSRSSSVDPNIDFDLYDDQKPSQAKKKVRNKGKAKGSAALALAVVTAKSRGGSEPNEDEDAALHQEGNNVIGRKRKNNPIPLPIPVPNLNKKSRGRKVPYVANLGAVNDVKVENCNETTTRGSTRSRKQAPVLSTPAIELAHNRTYVCSVASCGKCFVRGEHLKRHIRSIHTHEKPFPCPYDGCEKSFSRRDNLGQHVRIHLQQ